MKALVFGEIIWDIYQNGKSIGGAPFNFAAHLAHYGDFVFLLSAVGDDTLGEEALLKAKNFGIDTNLVQKNKYPTGVCLVTLDENGQPKYKVKQQVAYDYINITDEIISYINKEKPELFYFNSLIQRNVNSAAALHSVLDRCHFKEVFCDINIRNECWSLESLDFCLKRSDTIKISEEETHFLYDAGLLLPGSTNVEKAITNTFPNVKTVIYTMGEKGSIVYDATTEKSIMSGRPKPSRVVSAVGAGDCYAAAYCSAVHSGKSTEEAIKIATEQSAYVVSQKEAVPW